MKKLFLGTLLLGLAIISPLPAVAGIDVGVSISLPSPIVFAAPPELIVLPETYVYVVPDVDVDIFFYGGWWWRPWEGRWYRSRSYSSGWIHYDNVPSFYAEIPSGWRNDYRERRWQGLQWNYQQIPHQQVQRNWRDWEKSRHWEKQKTWGVKGLQPRLRSQKTSRDVQLQKSRPQVKKVGPERSQQHPKAAKPHQSKQGQGNQKHGKKEK